MKIPTLIALSLIQFMIISDCYSQLTAEAGRDTVVCESDSPVLTIGGDPTASGGDPPYNYTWSGSFDYAGKTYTASYMLDDTTVANPTFREGTLPDSVILYVSIGDAEGNTSMDSIQVRLSRYVVCLGECRFEITDGDSAQLGHCVSGGLPPLSFLWEPAETLSNASVQDPWAKPLTTTTYTLLITDSKGCQIESKCKVYVLPVGVDDATQDKPVELTLDPSAMVLHVRILQDFVPNSTFELISLSGTTMLKKTVDSEFMSIELMGLEHGLYLYRWTSKEMKIASGKVLL